MKSRVLIALQNLLKINLTFKMVASNGLLKQSIQKCFYHKIA